MKKKADKYIYKAKTPPGYDVKVVDISAEFFEMIKKPAHGFGKHMNPCIDCKILMLGKARELMPEYDAGFVITGEVLGQRPMTQNAALIAHHRERVRAERFSAQAFVREEHAAYGAGAARLGGQGKALGPGGQGQDAPARARARMGAG